MNLKKLIDCSILKEAMIKFNYKDNYLSKLKILDCTYAPTPPMFYKDFKNEFYGQFDKLNKKLSKHKTLYLKEHISNSIFLDIDTAFYPSRYKRFDVYEPKIFEKYVQMLGINNDDFLVFYGRGRGMLSMLFAARMYWLFKSYGHQNLSVLDGGFNSWKEEYMFETTLSKDLEKLPKGNWTAKDNFVSSNVSYEDLNNGLFEKLDEINFLDARPKLQFDGVLETGLNGYSVNGSHIQKTKNVPVLEMITDFGKRKSEKEIFELLEKANFDYKKPTYTLCMVGMQASLLSFILDTLSTPIPSKLYNGSLYEIERLSPEKINGGKLQVNNLIKQ